MRIQMKIGCLRRLHCCYNITLMYFPTNASIGLLLMCDVEHAIDLILGYLSPLNDLCTKCGLRSMVNYNKWMSSSPNDWYKRVTIIVLCSPSWFQESSARQMFNEIWTMIRITIVYFFLIPRLDGIFWSTSLGNTLLQDWFA